VARLRLDVAALRLGLDVVPASIDVQRPSLPEVILRLTGSGRRCVVVPLLLAAGYHVRVDVAGAVAAGGHLARFAPALGPDPALVDVLVDRLTESGAGHQDAVVLGAAGSSDPDAVRDVEQVAFDLADRLDRPVRAGYLSAAFPTLPDAVTAARREGRPVTVATFLLSPGFFADQLAERAVEAGATRTTAAMAPHHRLAELVLRRYDETLGAGV
jgi:sirohydrochlorin ferrochelatase